MKKVTSSDVQEVLFHFLQHAFIGEPAADHRRPTPEIEEWLFARLEMPEALTVQELSQWPMPCKDALRELVSQYLIFVSMFKHLPYPAIFLDGCTALRLEPMVLAWFAQRRWPFPQQFQR